MRIESQWILTGMLLICVCNPLLYAATVDNKDGVTGDNQTLKEVIYNENKSASADIKLHVTIEKGVLTYQMQMTQDLGPDFNLFLLEVNTRPKLVMASCQWLHKDPSLTKVSNTLLSKDGWLLLYVVVDRSECKK